MVRNLGIGVLINTVLIKSIPMGTLLTNKSIDISHVITIPKPPETRNNFGQRKPGHITLL